MKFSTREDIDAPIETVFQAVTNFDHFERQAMRRGAEIERLAPDAPFREGFAWAARIPYRGRMRDIKVSIRELRSPEAYSLFSESGGVESTFDVTLLALSRTRTRLQVGLDLRPKSIPARIFIQSLKLAKSNLNDKFETRVANFAREIPGRSNFA
jgi:hypothetical protein